MEKNNVGFAIWCVIYSVIFGVDADDCPIEVSKISEFEALLNSTKFIKTLGMTKKTFVKLTEQAYDLVDEKKIWDVIEFYNDYSQILRDASYNAQARDILNAVYEKFPDKADDLGKIMDFAGIR